VPLTPFAPGTLLDASAASDPQARAALQFLSYHEKFLAGSWRFLTYFGRDTLMSVRLLMPALQPEAVETGLRSVLERLAPDGNVAHEEDIGEFAILDHRRTGENSAVPTYNYNMVDSSFLLAPVAAAWFIDDPRGRARATAFLADGKGGKRPGDALMENVRFVLSHAEPFARNPMWQNLVSLKQGMDAGEWRDSNDGLGGGRYPYDINAVLVPAALRSIDAMARLGLLAPYATDKDKVSLEKVAQMAATWSSRAPELFAQQVAPATARQAITRYAAITGVPASAALLTITNKPTRYNAIALDAQGKPVPILNSDEGFALLFGQPSPEALDIAAATISRPFPAGLMTGVGMLVANPVFAQPALQKRFSPAAYHGTVIWSWQQALVAAGLERQIARSDLPASACTSLRTAQASLWRAIDAGRSVQSSELWSWRYEGGGYKIAPFGATGGDADESNAAQLWSTVYLAVKRPAGTVRCGAR
jgi:glycogen debranching enzyme